MNNTTKARPKGSKSAASPLAQALDIIGDPWSLLIHQEAFFGVRRFDDFQRNLAIPKNTLADRLKRLVRQDMLKRVAYQQNPPRFDYRLTARGLDSYPYALSLMRWGDDWLSRGREPPVRLRHKICGTILRPLATCGACRDELTPDTVTIPLESARAPAQPRGARMRTSSRPELYIAGRTTSVGRTLAAIGDRWGFFIIWLAFAGVSRFENFHSILGIARTILTARLERLVKQGVLRRRRYQARPPRSEYLLTEKGRDLYLVLLTFFGWANRSFEADKDDTCPAHTSCGAPLEVLLVCSACRAPLSPHEVLVLPTTPRRRLAAP
ncbi:MAG: winged helix-turn-helix transcriptional regulator [Hyphomonadaceae bacterium]